MATQNNKKHILGRYYFITGVFLLLSAAIVTKLFITTVVEAQAWNERAVGELSRIDTIAPERGKILANNGNILACNIRVYDIKLDLRHDILKRKKIDWAKVDSLADSLDFYFPKMRGDVVLMRDSAEKYSWHSILKRELQKPFAKRRRALRLVKQGSMLDYEQIKEFPWLRDFNNKTPLYKETRMRRQRPYGEMAGRSIGKVTEFKKPGAPEGTPGEMHGYSGLEKDLDSLLYGTPGLARRIPLTNGVTRWVSKKPVRGYDILTTIDIDIQDILEEELMRICVEHEVEWGTSIIMEVATGEIKAISNLERFPDGTYGEAINRAVMGFEPGSVMKPISLLIAFEDGLVKTVNDMVDTSPFQGTTDPHGATMKTVKQVIECSSNTGISRIIFRGYKDDPSKFYDRLASIGFFEKMHTGIAGEQIPSIRKLLPKDRRGNNITMTARHLDLARQAFGYNTEIPPLYTLSIYNAIANDGRYVRPHLVKALIDENGHDSIMPIDYIRDRICSIENARKLRECIREVVWGDHGTARLVRDDRVEIAGKTGTAFPIPEGQIGYDRSRRRLAFAGFFPYDKPIYSCMTLIMGKAGLSANRTSGQVVKNVAIKLYARGMLNNQSTFTHEKSNSAPILAASKSVDTDLLKTILNLPIIKQIRTAVETSATTVPDVRGYDITAAISMLESRGLNVKIKGEGSVVAQSLTPDTKIKKGQIITLTLKI